MRTGEFVDRRDPALLCCGRPVGGGRFPVVGGAQAILGSSEAVPEGSISVSGRFDPFEGSRPVEHAASRSDRPPVRTVFPGRRSDGGPRSRVSLRVLEVPRIGQAIAILSRTVPALCAAISIVPRCVAV